MQVCKQCGKEFPDGGAFCSECGAPVESGVTPEPMQQPVSFQTAPEGASQSTAGSFAEKLHAQCGSTLFLVAMILFSAACFFNFVYGAFQAGEDTLMAGVSIFIAFLTLLVSALPCVAGWLIYASSIKPQQPELSVTSMTLLKIYAIVEIVVMSLALFLLLIATIVFFVGGNSGLLGLLPKDVTGLFSGAAALIGVILLIITLIAAGVFYPYIIFVLQAIRSAREGLTLNNTNVIRGGKVVAVFLFVFAGLGILSSMTSGFGFLLQLIRQAAMVLFGVTILKLSE